MFGKEAALGFSNIQATELQAPRPGYLWCTNQWRRHYRKQVKSILFYYYRKSKLLKQMECVACEVRSNLKQQLGTLEKYARFYFVAGTILTPLAYFAAGILILFNGQEVNSHMVNVSIDAQTSVSQMPIAQHISNRRFFVLFLLIGAVLTPDSYFVNR